MAFRIIREKIRTRIWNLLKGYFYAERIKDSPLVINLNKSGDRKQKKVLICYVTYSHFTDLENGPGRTIPFEIFRIVRVFTELGYCIDIIGNNDPQAVELIKSRTYQVIFGFGESFIQMKKIQPLAISVLYMTENHPVFSLEEEKKRIEYFGLRHGKKVSISRSGVFYTPGHMQNEFSHVITLGDPEQFVQSFNNPFTLFPTGIQHPEFFPKQKNHSETRKGFLWLGSYGAIHKGLDLLIDVFRERPDLTLHICGLVPSEKKLLGLRESSNIIDHGYVRIDSTAFLNLADACSFIILPSCSEGFSTSITTGMMHGLIPVVTKDIGMNKLGKLAFFLDDYHIEYLSTRVRDLSNSDPGILNEMSINAYKFALDNFTPEAFERSFRDIAHNILK
jgi:glycosyltransferase involved in cell wall biosynthesis